MESIKREKHIIDADGVVLGKLGVQVTNLLRGKGKPDFYRHKDMGDFVTIKNVEKMKFTGKKFKQKIYYRHTGYLGGLKKPTLENVFDKSPSEVLRKAVMGMLPKNKLRAIQIKRLKFEK